MWTARACTRSAIAPGKRWIAGRSGTTGSRSAWPSGAASSAPSRSRRASGPEKAFCTGTCWSSAKPISRAIGSEAMRAFASSESVKCRRSGTRRSYPGGDPQVPAETRRPAHAGRLNELAWRRLAHVLAPLRELDVQVDDDALELLAGVVAARGSKRRHGRLVEVGGDVDFTRQVVLGADEVRDAGRAAERR